MSSAACRVLLRRKRLRRFTITCFGYTNSLSARAARRLLPRAPGARSSQLKATKACTNGRPKRTGAHLRAMEATRPAGDRRGAPGSVLRLSCPPPSSDASRELFVSFPQKIPGRQKNCLASGGCKLQQTRPWLGLVGLSRTPSGTFFREAHSGSEMGASGLGAGGRRVLSFV